MALPNTDPLRQVTFMTGTATPLDYGLKRHGRPKNRWATEGLEEYWTAIKHSLPSNMQMSELNITRPTHQTALSTSTRSEYSSQGNSFDSSALQSSQVVRNRDSCRRGCALKRSARAKIASRRQKIPPSWQDSQDAKISPRWPKMAPKLAQDRPKTGPRLPKTGPS